MKLSWRVEDRDRVVVTELMQDMHDHPFVRKRREENLERQHAGVGLAPFWHRLVMCLLSTQQRSGPGSPTSKFGALEPFPLSWEACRNRADLAEFARVVLTEFGGIRRGRKIGEELEANQSFVASSWEDLRRKLGRLATLDSVRAERKVASYIQGHLKGFGPKQSRNLLQTLGLTRYEIPIDSRITHWLNHAISFPIELTATALADENYYQFVCGAFQKLSKACGVYPCILDAAIFASYDLGKQDAGGMLW